MRTKDIIVAAAIMLIFLCSCEFQKSIELDLPGNEPKLAIIAYLEPGDHSLISLTQSVGLFDEAIPEPLSNPSCRVYEDEVLIEELSTVKQDGSFELPAEMKFNIGHHYQIDASSDGFASIRTQNIVIPDVIPIQKAIIFDTIDSRFIIHVTFDDPQNEKNYYVLKVDKYIDGQLLKDTLFKAPFIDPALTFSDVDFDGTRYTQILKVGRNDYYRNEYLPVEQLQLILISLSESTYKFMNSLKKYESTASDPTLENFPVYSNVINGYGILGGFATDTVFIQL